MPGMQRRRISFVCSFVYDRIAEFSVFSSCNGVSGLYHPASALPLSSSETRFREKNETWFCMAQMEKPAMAITTKSTMRMIAMVMFSLTMVAGINIQP